MVIPLSDTVANALHDSIYQSSRKPSIVWRRLLVLWINAVILTVAIQKLIRDELLDDVEDVLHKLGDLSV